MCAEPTEPADGAGQGLPSQEHLQPDSQVPIDVQYAKKLLEEAETRAEIRKDFDEQFDNRKGLEVLTTPLIHIHNVLGGIKPGSEINDITDIIESGKVRDGFRILQEYKQKLEECLDGINRAFAYFNWDESKELATRLNNKQQIKNWQKKMSS